MIGEITGHRQLAPVQRGVAETGQAVFGGEFERDEIAPRGADDHFAIDDFHGRRPQHTSNATRSAVARRLLVLRAKAERGNRDHIAHARPTGQDERVMHDIDEKVDRLARLATRHGLGGILLNTQPNFAWLTGGRSNQVDGSRENGSGSLLVGARGERFVVANNIEMPRLQEEALAGLDFTPREYRWTEEQADARTAVATAAYAVCGEIGCGNALS